MEVFYPGSNKYRIKHKFLKFFENIFCLEHLWTRASLSLIDKDSIAITRDSFKDCILTCKIRNQMHTNFEKRKVPQGVSGNFAQKWLFCKRYVLYNICSFICGQSS